MANWVFVKVLGKGSYGVVYLAKPIVGTDDDDHYFAVKVTPLHHHSSLSKEEQILKHFIGCPEIVQYLGSEITEEENSSSSSSCSYTSFYNLKLEYAAGGTLADLIKRRKKLPENEVKNYLKMILKGLSCIHRKGFVHVDLKPDNILVFPESDGSGGEIMKLKIADFGLSRRCGEMDDEEECGTASFRGTPKYMSPESIIYSEINSALDIWSLGCVLVKMVSGKSVWRECRGRRELMVKLLEDMEIPKIPSELSEKGKDFIGKCFQRLYKERWTAEMLLQHPYLKADDGISKLQKEDHLPHFIYKPKPKL